LTHIKAPSALQWRNGTVIEEDTLTAAEDAIESADWAAFRGAIAKLRADLLPDPPSGQEADPRLRQILDALAAVSPAHDPEGCRSELAALGAILRLHPPAAPVMRELPPLVDLRGLEPPQPIVRILDALERAPDAPLRVVLPHEPHPLYDLLRRRGCEWSGSQRADGGFELTIRGPAARRTTLPG
jgi:hypothetical protein